MEEPTATLVPTGGVGFWKQTWLLIEKNWKCKMRSDKKKLLGEIFIPVLYLSMLSLVVKTQPNRTYPAQTEPDSNPMNILHGLRLLNYAGNERIISVAPNSTEVQNLCNIMQQIWADKKMGPLKLNFAFFADGKSLEEAHNNGNTTDDIDIAIIFSEFAMPNKFNYTILTDPNNPYSPPVTSNKIVGLDTCRMNKNQTGATNTILEIPATCPVNGYFYSGFLALQYLTDQALLHMVAESNPSVNSSIPNVEMQNYPKLEFNGGMSLVLRAIIPLYSVISMAQFINSLLVLIVTEKEDRIKDGFRMIGVSDAAYWLSWFTVYSVIIGILSILFTIVMHLTSILRNINIALLFLLFFLFGLSVITFAFALTPFFHKPKTAGVVGTLIMQFCGMLFMLQTFVKTSTDAFLIPMRLVSSLAFTTALDEAAAFEYQGGIGFSDIHPNGRGSRIFYSLIFICFDTVLYGLIAIYLDNVIPNEYGARKHPLFCFSSSLWKNKKSFDYRRSSLSDLNSVRDSSDDPNVEKVPNSMIGKEAIRIRNIKKTYTSLFGSTKVEAVKGITMEIYDGQITAILGKNGAGKSTLFSIITGLVPPTSGKSIVFGMDTSNPYDLDKLRKITGVCLQSNLHFTCLTVEEHLRLYGKLRGLRGDVLDSEVTSLMNELHLTEKRNTQAENLSGGQKRKLSVAIALIGDPKIILLDEPSAGVDPVSRRHLWSLLKRKREGKVILLTTHFLDEADFLADRKAVIHDGVLKCQGSSLFLKNRFGVGYHLTVETQGKFDSGNCDAVIKKWAPAALSSKKVIGKEIKYCLPHSEVRVFADLFSDLENLISIPDSPFKSYGVSMTTLEEVFLKISNDAWEDKERATVARDVLPEGSSNPSRTGEECNLIPDLNQLKVNMMASFWSLCLLRIRRLIRSPQSLFLLLVVPPALVAAGLGLMKTQDISAKSAQQLLPLNIPKDIYSEEEQRRVAITGGQTAQNFAKLLAGKGIDTLTYSGIYSDLLKNNLSDPGTMSAINLESSSTNLRINGTFLHSPPILLSMHNQFYMNKGGQEFSISANAKSFPVKKTMFDTSTFYAVFFIGPSFTLPAVGMVMELVKDREIRARNHLRVNGVSFGLYFSSIFFVFGVLSVIVTLIQIALIYIFSLASFMNVYAMTVTIVLLLLFIPSCLLFSTIFSYLFNTLESAQTVFSTISSWMGTLVGLVIIVMDGVNVDRKIVLLVHGIVSALDVFYIPFGVFYWINKQYILCVVTDTCEELTFKDYLGPEIVIMALCLVVQVPVFLALVFIADIIKNEGSLSAAFAALFNLTDKNANRVSAAEVELERNEDSDSNGDTVDEDIEAEKLRVANILNVTDDAEDSSVVVQNLKKTYRPNRSLKDKCRNKNVQGHKALKGINFVVEPGEVFGLLGHNGAGKTTAMKIIIAEESADSGKVRLCGHDIFSSHSEAFLRLGYCAQHDPLWENITLEEHLELYAVVRGIPKDSKERLIKHFMAGLQIEEHAKKKASQLSGGTKRKLSYGMSMLGAPKIVLLDEPSTGMDPQSKRFLWNTILGTFKESRGAILTTHSMEEAEILSTRIAILAKGSFICIGSPQHLKSKYGTGYTLEIKLKSQSGVETSSTPDQKFSFVQENFPDCKVNEMFDDKAVFSLSTTSIQSISRAFLLLEQLKERYDIEEYSFSQTTLEQIFLLFAKEADDESQENANAGESEA